MVFRFAAIRTLNLNENNDFSRKSEVNIYGLEKKSFTKTAENQYKFIKGFALI